MPAKSERSAGVIVFHTDPALEDLLLDYGRHWDYPKGHIEESEDELSAALRELDEETGLRDVRLIEGFHERITYSFRKPRKGLIRKGVVFFLAQTTRKRVTISHEHTGYAFLPFKQAVERVTYASSKDVLRSAHAFLTSERRDGVSQFGLF
jgi:8-oxo-dGTP pyrophosphatase MutT (NUDIX family)